MFLPTHLSASPPLTQFPTFATPRKACTRVLCINQEEFAPLPSPTQLGATVRLLRSRFSKRFITNKTYSTYGKKSYAMKKNARLEAAALTGRQQAFAMIASKCTY